MAANHSGTFMLNSDVNTLSQMISNPNFLNHLNLVINSRFMEGNSLRFNLRHGVTFSSWGEDINILLTPINSTSTQVYIRSECAMPTQIIDWGKNKENVNTIYSVLANNLKNFQASNQATPLSAAQPAVNSVARFCSACGAAVIPGSLFCSSCGHKL